MSLKYRALAGAAAAALAVIGGAVAATAATGSPDPAVWGETVTQAVATCKADLKGGEHGIGQCVSAVARQNGPAERAEHSQAPEARTDEHGKASREAHGKPSDVPKGPPGTPPGRR